jgi:putative ABC transport system substrate-binding protein
MTLPSTHHLAASAVLAVLSLFPLQVMSADVKPERLILYVNEDGVRVHDAIGQLEAALRRSGVTSRHRFQLHHVVVDLWQPANIRAKLLLGLQLHPAAIIATNSDIAAIAKSLTTEVPVIFACHQDPIRLGLIDSLAHPGGNLTGFTYFVPVDAKRLELLRQLAPGARKVGILIDRWWMEESGGKDAVLRARSSLGFEPHLFEAESLEDLHKALATPEAREMDAWYIPSTVLAFYQPVPMVAAFAALRKPAMFPSTQFVEQGALVSYQQLLTLVDSAQLFATMIGLVLDGLPPGEIPIERPKSFELAVNVAEARRLGLTVSPNLIKRADRVFDAIPVHGSVANR